MLNIFRSFMKSKVGAALALLFLGLIALAFAAADVTGSGTFGSVTGGDRVASVGKRKISTADLGQAATTGLEQVKQNNPRLTMQAFVAGGGLTEALDQLVDRAAISEFGAEHGVIASDRLVDSELAKIDAFKGIDGKFSTATFKAVLAQRGLNEAAVRQDIADGLVARQLLVPAAFGAKMPQSVVGRYAALLTEQRTGSIALIPSGAFAPKAQPTDADLAAYYSAHRDNFIRPERREIRWAVFDDAAIKNVPAPTEAEIAARYNGNKAQYAATESRKVTQLLLPTEAAAKAVLAEVSGGKTLEAAASAKGLAVAAIGPSTKTQLTTQTNPALADAVFAAAKGAMAGPIKATLGWAILRVDVIDQRPGKTLDQARAEISADLAAQKKRTALSDFSSKIEEEFDNGGSLGDVAKELSLTLQQTEPLTADGKVYTKGTPAPAELARVLQTAFSMEREGQPQLAEIEPGKKFVVFDVARITASAPAPLAEIRGDVASAYLLEKGAAAAKAAAEKVSAQARKGTDLGAALAGLGVAGLPPVQRLNINRQEFSRQANGIPPALGLLFSMAQGTTKVLAAPGGQGWFVVSLAKIVPGTPQQAAPLLASATAELSQMTSREYAEQLRKAMRDAVGFKKNQIAIDAVSRQLTGTGN
ncbi:SurA N-terminal domain-containing protein [Novosphingobium flavum]|uniref:Parvulin-like PPIase n=1 Tax=Novosphingobium flavum TaxID=1778672 RepID=A0A7X1FTZ2_9SPHN|nr:SurA N-terminal domain-containing protein [Novosphingobium flavum]MBC2666407.1 SurA N-terminal domain-containing protein [Novosphingobium flavum]